MVTLKEIAKKVGVSPATVSRVLNFDTTLSVAPQKRQAIIETAEALSYATPRARKRTRQRNLHRVALVHFLRPEQELIDPYYVGLRLGIESRCHELKIETIKVYHTVSMPDPTLLHSADGVIAIGIHSSAEIDWLREHSRHLVFADFSPPGDEFNSVDSDLRAATRKMLNALKSMGYNRIGFAGWADSPDEPYAETRCRAYVEWSREFATFEPNRCVTEHSLDRTTEEFGHRLAPRLLSSPELPDAILTSNDNIAVGIYRALHERGLRIPDDIAVASFNDISVAQFLNPPLTTIRLPAEDIGKTAVDLLIERLDGSDLTRHVSIANRIIWRRSTRTPEEIKIA
ncbi:LacI family DNA-binding transcriptional regulator [Devosia rhodophyticola]|uniref:LacI family DNA-binding transcriptional regulator n=1 Tax=Devosia rhodophyticola TaxID=3026423 RepID=A0ABY7YWR6_9HYPH|nr:LacI family DNA-binding transcriptional regulator [Devosia rhodophyticola]WDR05647.1 LacI family DNA-binding transcriptional regulator [Devosia rhodophyticola]